MWYIPPITESLLKTDCYLIYLGKNIVGCYAPDGDHAEKVLENGLKANAAFISVFEETKPPAAKKSKKRTKEEEEERRPTIIEGMNDCSPLY